MARFKHYDYSQLKLIPVSFQEQILPGTFEYTVNCLVDHEVDLTVFEARYQNEETGAPAYDPAILLKIILYAYSKGVSSSREMARLCQEHVVFKLRRFSLRSQRKVNTQWLLYCLVHNIGKLHRYGRSRRTRAAQ